MSHICCTCFTIREIRHYPIFPFNLNRMVREFPINEPMPPPDGHRRKARTHHKCRWRWGISVCQSNKDLQILWWKHEPGSFSSPDSGRWGPAGPPMTGSLTEKRQRGNIPDQMKGKSLLYQHIYVKKMGTGFIFHLIMTDLNFKRLCDITLTHDLNYLPTLQWANDSQFPMFRLQLWRNTKIMANIYYC